MEPKKPLEAGITFQSVIDQNPDDWAAQTPEFKTNLADAFFSKHVASQTGFSEEPPEIQNEIKLQFNKKYDVGHVSLGDNLAPDGVSQIAGRIHRLGDLATLGLPARAWDASHFGVGDTATTRDAQLSQYQTDPGFLGDLYRTSQLPVVKGLGGLAGAFRGTSNITKPILQSGLGATVGQIGQLPGLKQLIGTADKAAFTAGNAAYSGISNAFQAFNGNQNPLQAFGQTALDIATGGIGGRTRIGNAAAQAAAGGGGSLASNVIHGQPLNLNQAIEQALTQAGVGAAFHGNEPKVPARKDAPLQSTGQDNAMPPPPPPTSGVGASPSVDRKAQAIEIYNALNSQDAQTRLQAKALVEELKARSRDKRSKTDPGRIRKPGDSGAKEILTHLQMHGESQRKGPPKKTFAGKQDVETIAARAVKYREKGGKMAAAFENYLDRNYSREDKRVINARAREMRGETKAQIQTEEKRAKIRRDQGKAKVTDIAQARQKTAIEERQAQNERIKAEKEKQKTEAQEEKSRAAREQSGREILSAVIEATGRPKPKTNSTLERQAAGPDEYKRMSQQAKAQPKPKTEPVAAPEKPKPKQAPVLDNADVERLSNELVAHKKANEKGQLDAKLTEYRKNAKADHTKAGASADRSEAIKLGHQRVLDAYAQKAAAAEKKPSANQVKAGQEANRVELGKLNEQGGRYTAGNKEALQRPAKGFTLEEAQKTDEWDRLDPAAKNKAKIAMQAAKNDGKVIIEYDAERSGDTGQFKLKTVSPLSLDITGNPKSPNLILHAVNENGHAGTYYLTPSKPNEKTGFASYTHDITALPETKGQAKKSLDANAYHGQREVPVSDIMSRPKRVTAGYTSETEALLARAAEGGNVHEVRKALKQAAKKKGKLAKSAESINKMADQSPAIEATVTKAAQSDMTKSDMGKLSNTVKKTSKSGRKKVIKDTGC